MTKSTLYIIPIPISDDTFHKVLPDYNKQVIDPIRVFVVEKIKTARQFLRKMNSEFPIDDCTFFELDKHQDYQFQKDLFPFFTNGQSIGLLSESGYPGVADPGTTVVYLAHKNNCDVIPLVGPSSILMALASSGMNGQGFTFHGYLPKQQNDWIKKVKDIIINIQKTGYAHLFIETPYRNKQFFDEMLSNCPTDLKMTIAYDITGENQIIKTKLISDWKKNPFVFDKFPCVFVLGN